MLDCCISLMTVVFDVVVSAGYCPVLHGVHVASGVGLREVFMSINACDHMSP